MSDSTALLNRNILVRDLSACGRAYDNVRAQVPKLGGRILHEDTLTRQAKVRFVCGNILILRANTPEFTFISSV